MIDIIGLVTAAVNLAAAIILLVQTRTARKSKKRKG